MAFRDRGKTPYDNEYGPTQHSEIRVLIPINKLWNLFKKKKSVEKKEQKDDKEHK